MNMTNAVNLHDFTRGAPMLRQLRILSDSELRAKAPAAFAESAHFTRSDRYAYIPTTRVIEALRDNGFHPVSAMQSRSRCGREDFTKHMLKFARMDGRDLIRVGDTIPQVALVNSHDGTSAYSLIAALYRLACNNGLMIADSTVQSVKVQHTGNIVDRVIEGSFSVIDGATNAGEVSRTWGAIHLAPPEQAAFINAATVLRYGEDKPPVDAQRFGLAKRDSDVGNDLWRTFNRAQENLVGGGQRGRNTTGRRQTVRPVAAIDGNVKLNRALWSLAEEMARLKGQAVAA